MTQLKAYFDQKGEAVFTAGKLLKGTIELFLNESRKINGLYFIVFGVVKCQRKHSEPCINYKRKEVILNTKTFLLASEKSNSVRLASGTYSFGFECQLPDSLPASLEASHGYIRYHIAACLDTPWRSEKRFRLEFRVVRNDDLNDFPELKLPCTKKRAKKFRNYLFQSEQISMTAALSYGGYTPGQHVPVITHFENQSDIQVNRTRFSLVRKIRYKSSSSKCKTEVEKIVEVFGGGVKRKTSKIIEENLLIPQLQMISNEKYCEAIQVSYGVEVEAEISGSHKNIVVFIPIVIGSRALNFKRSLNAVLSPTMVNNIRRPSAPSDPPPSFEEALKMNFEQPIVILDGMLKISYLGDKTISIIT